MGLVHAQCGQSPFSSSHGSLFLSIPTSTPELRLPSPLLCSCQQCAVNEPFSTTQTGFDYPIPFPHSQAKTYQFYNHSWSKLLCTTKSLIIYFLP